MTFRILLVDDHELVRNGLRDLVSVFTGCEVVGEAPNGRDGLQLALALKPDLVLLDINMPVMGGIECATLLRQQLPGTKVIMLSMHRSADMVQTAQGAGALGYVVKDSAAEKLEAAIRTVMAGEAYFPKG